MKDIQIDKRLYDTYPEIRLGCLEFETEVKEPDEGFWAYLDQEVLPKIRRSVRTLREKSGERSSESGAAGRRIGHLGGILDVTECPPRRCCGESVAGMSCTM